MCYESHHVIGATKYIMFGSCGSLDKETTRGKFIIPTESYRGEGASHYYAPSSDYITIKNCDVLAEVFEKIKKVDPEYLILEMNFDDIEDTLKYF